VHQLVINFDDIKMHGTTVKMIEDQQARLCTSHKNIKLKLIKTNAAVWFHKMWEIKRLKPNYIKIKKKGAILM
jgi:hypothetical protein